MTASCRPRPRSVRPCASRPPAWLAVAFVAGAVCWNEVLRIAPGAVPGLVAGRTAPGLPSAGASPWVQAAAGYQQLYTRDPIAHLQPDSQASARIVDEIRAGDGLALHIPDLRDSGLA
jgi:hypothetical protein